MLSSLPLPHDAALDFGQLRRLHRVGLLAILLIAAIVVAGMAALEYSARWVQHTREVLRTVRELQSGMLQLESRAQLEAHTTRLLALTTDNPTQRERARQLAAAVAQWAEERTALPRDASAPTIDASTATLQQVLQEFQADESALYDMRVARQQRWRATLVATVLGALVLVAFALHRMTSNVFREAGQRMRVQDERDRAQTLLDFALDRSPLAVAVLERDNSLRVANNAWRALEPTVRPTGASHGAGLASELAAVVERVRDTGEAAVVEMVLPDHPEAGTAAAVAAPMLQPTGSGRVLLVSAHRLAVDSDSAVGLVLLDLSEQRWLETQLRHAQRMESLGRLAGGVAHDINNVVTAIIGFTDMAIAGMRAADTAEQVDADLQQVRRAADRAAVMARQLLSFSRQRIAQVRPLDMSEVVRDIEPMLRRILGSHVQFFVDAPSQEWAVLADPGQIEQVLLNLTINARDAMEHGGELTVSVHAVDRAQMAAASAQRAWWSSPTVQEGLPSADARTLGEGLCLMVRDTGSGIPPAVQARMFDPFFTTKAEGKGTGLGLATVRQIVDDLGGFVVLQSAAGEGTRIAVYLPRTAGHPEPLRNRVSRGARLTHTGRIIVAEDDRDVRYLIEHVLSDAGYTVHTARSGRDALSAIERATTPYQLLITDLVMPEVDGVGLGSHALVEEHVGRVLYMSGYPADSHGEQTALPPHVRFLAKPFSPAGLLEAVDEALSGDLPDGPQRKSNT